MGFKFGQNIEFLIAILKVFLRRSKCLRKESCSTKCNGMFNSSCNIIDHTPLPIPGFSDFEVYGRHLR